MLFTILVCLLLAIVLLLIIRVSDFNSRISNFEEFVSHAVTFEDLKHRDNDDIKLTSSS
jgi:hypothetical protein